MRSFLLRQFCKFSVCQFSSKPEEINMENYSALNRKALASLGINFEATEVKYETQLKVLSAVLMICSTFQMLMYVITNSEFSVEMAIAFSVGLYNFQGCCKFFAVLRNMEKLKKIKTTFEVLTKKEQILENHDELERIRIVTKTILVMNLSSIWFNNILPMITLAYFLISCGTVVQKLPYAFWFPFTTTIYNYFAIYLFEIICAHVLTVLPLSIDCFMILMIGRFIVLFKCLGENIASIVNEFEASKRSESVEKLNKAVDLHNQLLDLSAELFKIFEIPLLMNILAQIISICFVACIATVSKISDLSLISGLDSFQDSTNGDCSSFIIWNNNKFRSGFFALLVWRKDQIKCKDLNKY